MFNELKPEIRILYHCRKDFKVKLSDLLRKIDVLNENEIPFGSLKIDHQNTTKDSTENNVRAVNRSSQSIKK